MVSILDIGLVSEFRILFPFLLILCLVYAILSYTKVLGDDKVGVNALVAFVLAVMSLFSDIVIETINVAAPWFVLLLVFGIFLMLAFMVLGLREADITKTIRNPDYHFIGWWIFIIVLIIMIGSASHVLSAKKGGYPPFTTGENATAAESQENAFWETMFHPKVLGFITIMLIAFITVNRLTSAKP